MSARQTAGFVEVDGPDGRVRIEHAQVGAADAPGPLVVFLHEGLGSVAMWKDFPARLCAALGGSGVVYSRPGYGRSTPRPAGERWGAGFMHRQAHGLLPALLRALGVAGRRPWLLGHSDGASIALLQAARPAQPLAGVVALAAHVFVEDLTVASIERARQAYEGGALRARLAAYHDDPDSAFGGWCGAWLDPAFRRWNIEADIAAIACPLLAVQGRDDEYGTMAQLRRIARRVPQAQLLELDRCGHSPHRDRPDALIDAVCGFVAARGAGTADTGG